MIGIFAIISKNIRNDIDKKIYDMIASHPFEGVYSSLHARNLFVARNIINKFNNDQVFFSDDNIAIIIDGVLLNSKQLMKEYNVSNMTELFQLCINNNSIDSLLTKLRGSFCGLIANKSKFYIFTDQLATKQLFYANIHNSLIISSEVGAIVNYFKIHNIKYNIDKIGVYSLMSYAYMYMNHTFVKEIKRIKEGNIIEYDLNSISQCIYYEIPSREIDISKDNAIEEIDRLFLKAVKLQIEKNSEYGYYDVIPLSAGMDCRMTSFAAKRIANKPLLNFSYSEFGQEDCNTPGLMARALGNKWLFKNLDNGLDMFNIQESIEIADGLIYYLWPAQLNDFLRLVNTKNWGIVHTGVLGDVILGCWNNTKYVPYRIGNGAYSNRLISKLHRFISEQGEIIDSSFEKGMFMNRGINGACMGYSTTFRHYCIDLSPFMNIDFFNFCLSLPFKFRKDHSIYYEWVRKKYPLAAKFKHNGVTLRSGASVNFKGKKIRFCSIKDLVIRKYKILQRDIFNKDFGMNPQESWLKNNSELQYAMTKYFNDNITCLESWPEIYNDACDLFNNGNAIEKSLAISVVGTTKLFFSE